MKFLLMISCLMAFVISSPAQQLEVTGIEVSLPNQVRVILTLKGKISGVIPPSGAVIRVGPTITGISGTSLMRAGGKIISVGDVAITRIGGQILSLGDIPLTRAGGKIVTIGDASIKWIGNTILSLDGDPRVRLVLGM